MSRNKKRKGIVLAGGKGTRLSPLTLGCSKPLLPVYDKPLIYYPISILQSFGIEDILIIGSDQQNVYRYLKATKHLKGNFSFEIQTEARGLSDAFLVGEKFCEGHPTTLVLGDNIFDGNFNALTAENLVYGYKVKNPQAYGVIDFNKKTHEVKRILEKPDTPPTNFAVPGLYHFDHTVVEKAKRVQPSARGELEITDLINLYIDEHNMKVSILPDDMAWFDCGTFDHLLEASNYVKAIQNRTARVVGKVKES